MFGKQDVVGALTIKPCLTHRSSREWKETSRMVTKGERTGHYSSSKHYSKKETESFSHKRQGRKQIFVKHASSPRPFLFGDIVRSSSPSLYNLRRTIAVDSL